MLEALGQGLPRDRRLARRDQPADDHRPGDVIALDAKMNFDDNALFRHADIAAMRDLAEENPLEVEAVEVQPQLHQARRRDRLHGERRRPGDGDHGHHQARAAASRPTSSTSAAAPARRRWRARSASWSRIPSVEAVLINIFGGIARTDRIARGVVGGAARARAAVNAAGGGAARGHQRRRGPARSCASREFHFIVADTMADGAEKVVAAVKARRGGRR